MLRFLSILLACSLFLSACAPAGMTQTTEIETVPEVVQPAMVQVTPEFALAPIDMMPLDNVGNIPVVDFVPDEAPELEKSLIMTIDMPADEIALIAADLESAYYGEKTMSCRGKLAAPAQINMCNMAKRYLQHVTNIDDVNRMTRFAGKYFWPTSMMLAIGLSEGKIIPMGFVLGKINSAVGLWFRWNHPVRGELVNLYLVLAEAPSWPTLIPVYEVNKYGSVFAQIARFIHQTAQYNQATGNVTGKIFLTAEAAQFLKSELNVGYRMIWGDESRMFFDFMKDFGRCLQEEIRNHPEYQKSGDSQKNTGEAPKIDFRLEKDEAMRTSTVITVVGIVLILVKIGAAGITQQYYLLLIPTP